MRFCDYTGGIGRNDSIKKQWYGLLTAENGLLPPVRLHRIPKAVPLPDDLLLPIDLDYPVVALVGDQSVAILNASHWPGLCA